MGYYLILVNKTVTGMNQLKRSAFKHGKANNQLKAVFDITDINTSLETLGYNVVYLKHTKPYVFT